MTPSNQKNHYLKTQVETASKEQLVVLLFDGIIRFTEQARKAIAGQAIEDAHNSLMRAQAIIMELICTIDKEKGGEVAKNLLGLHAYAFNCLVVCNMKKDVSKIDEVQHIYRELRTGWIGAMDSLGLSSSAKGPVAAPSRPAEPGLSGAALAKSPAAAPASGHGVQTAAVAGVRDASGEVPSPVSRPAAAPVGYGPGKPSGLLAARDPGKTQAAPGPQRAPTVSATPVAARHAALLNAYTAGAGGLA